jgi:hypothetical protein
MAQQTITISYVTTYASGGVPTTNATVIVSVPIGIDATLHTRNIWSSGGAWVPGASGNQVFIPTSQIFQITSP